MNDFIDHVVKMAEETLTEGKEVLWTFFGRSSITGKEHRIVAPFANDKEKERSFNAIRLYAVVHQVDEYIVVSEAWMAFSDKPEIEGNVADRPDRKECLIVCHVKRENEKRLGRGRLYTIDRNPVVLKRENYETGKGPLADLIPPITPTPDQRKQSEAVASFGRSKGFLPSFTPVLRSIPGGKA